MKNSSNFSIEEEEYFKDEITNIPIRQNHAYNGKKNRGLSSDQMQADNPEDLNLLFYDFNKSSKEKAMNMKRTNQIMEATEENEDDENYSLNNQFPGIASIDVHDNSFDKRKQTDNADALRMYSDDIQGIRQSDGTPMSIK